MSNFSTRYRKRFRILPFVVVPTLCALSGTSTNASSIGTKKLRRNRPLQQRLQENNVFKHKPSISASTNSTELYEAETNFVEVLLPLNRTEETTVTIETRQGSTTGTCQLNENGFFGQPIGQFYEIGYLYQTTVVTNTSLIDIVNEIAPALDRSITESVLPFLFSSQCTTTNGRIRQRRFLQTSNTVDGVINAVSSLPEDQFILSGLSCRGTIVPGGDCYVVEGAMTILGDDFISIQEVESIVVPAIQFGIQSLQPPLDTILQIQFLSDDLQTTGPVTAPPIPPPSDPQPSTPSGTVAPSSASIGSPTSAPNVETTTTEPTSAPDALARTFKPTSAPDATAGSTEPTSAPMVVPTITFAPIPSLPTTLIPITPSSEPSLSPTKIPSLVGTISPSLATSVAPTLFDLTAIPTASAPVTPRSSDSGPDWWIFLIAVLGGAVLLFCGYLSYNARKNQYKLPPPDQKFAEITVRKNPEEAYEPPANNLDNIPAYEPPSSRDEYVPPGMGFNLTPTETPIIAMDNPEPIEDDGEDDNGDDDEEDGGDAEDQQQQYFDDQEEEEEDQQQEQFFDDQEEEDQDQQQDQFFDDQEEEDEQQEQHFFNNQEQDQQFFDDQEEQDEPNGNSQQFFDDEGVENDEEMQHGEEEFGDEEDEEIEEVEETYHEEDEELEEGEEVIDNSGNQEEEYVEEGEEEEEYFEEGDDHDGQEDEEFEEEEEYFEEDEQYEDNENQTGWGNQKNAFDNNF